MRTICIMCGQPKEISNMHKDYRKLRENDSRVFICCACCCRAKIQALHDKSMPFQVGWKKKR